MSGTSADDSVPRVGGGIEQCCNMSAAGNTCVCKPSEMTSLTAFMLCDVLRSAGVPSGVVNIVFGFGATAGAALVAHPSVPLISFTGAWGMWN